VVDGGTGTAARLDRQVAGKTGTTDDYRDAWFVGYVPQMVTASWLGFEQPRPMENVLGLARISGGSMPTVLWSAYMSAAVAGMEPEPLLLADLDRYVPPPPPPAPKPEEKPKPPKEEEAEEQVTEPSPIPEPTRTEATPEPTREPTPTETGGDGEDGD
jgi:penicillin-binding protein 1A